MVTSPLLERVLDPAALSALFQPIFDIRGPEPVLDSVECLLRGPRGSALEAPDVLFEFARLKRAESRVDRAAIFRIFFEASSLPEPSPRLHVNVHASTLGRDEGFVAFLLAAVRTAGLEPRDVTVELVEHSDFLDEKEFVAALASLRQAGVTIALDDVGLGTSNYRMMLVARPEILKVDRYLVGGAATDSERRVVLSSIVELGARLGADIVAEGIESEADLEAVRGLGIGLAQGYLLARPMPLDELRRLLEASSVSLPSVCATVADGLAM